MGPEETSKDAGENPDENKDVDINEEVDQVDADQMKKVQAEIEAMADKG